jgi:hypothetical protein
MDGSFVSMIRDHLKSQSKPLPFPPVTERDIEQAEKSLGFAIPPLLKSCYLKIGNEGFGPSYGILGLAGGYASDYGTLVEFYHLMRSDHQRAGSEWKPGLLLFCEFGCNIFTCVDCNQSQYPVSVFEEGEVWPPSYTLEDFFKRWIAGKDLISDGVETESIEIINPFTHKPTRLKKRVRRKK